jgi:hypothetical protein
MAERQHLRRTPSKEIHAPYILKTTKQFLRANAFLLRAIQANEDFAAAHRGAELIVCRIQRKDPQITGSFFPTFGIQIYSLRASWSEAAIGK